MATGKVDSAPETIKEREGRTESSPEGVLTDGGRSSCEQARRIAKLPQNRNACSERRSGGSGSF